MDSIDLTRIERRARLKYEWARARRALLGFGPSLIVVVIAALASKHPNAAVAFGGVMFVVGVTLLWYGRDVRRAVLPGLAMGLIPLVLGLCANHMGHACRGDHCMTLCVPACTAGGLAAGIGVSLIGLRWKQGLAFWTGATALTLLTGAMGCSCAGYTGVAGLAIGYAVGLLPGLLRRVRRNRQE
jgi:hypothetical protein